MVPLNTGTTYCQITSSLISFYIYACNSALQTYFTSNLKIYSEKSIKTKAHPPSCFIVMEIHQEPCVLHGSFLIGLFSFTGIHKLLAEAVAIDEIVSTTSPEPVSGKIFWSSRPAAATARQFALSACSAHCVHNTCCTDCISKCCLATSCTNKLEKLWSEEKYKLVIEYFR